MSSGARDLFIEIKFSGPERAIVSCYEEMPGNREQIVHGAVNGQNQLGMTDRFESTHRTLALPDRLVRDRGAIVRVLSRVMDGARHHYTMCGSVASEFVSHESPRCLALELKRSTKESGGSFSVPPCLDEDIQDLVILIHGSIQKLSFPSIRTKTSSTYR